MPVYNGIEFIEESVQSVKNQTYENWELIIGINGHPPDSDVYKTAKKYGNSKIKVADFQGISGKGNTLNSMITISSGSHIALLDVDDIWYTNKLELQIPYIRKYDVVGSWCVYFGDKTDFPHIPFGDLSSHNFNSFNPIINSSVIVKKELATWTENFLEDYELWKKLKNENKTFFNLSEILVKHRIHINSYFNSRYRE